MDVEYLQPCRVS